MSSIGNIGLMRTDFQHFTTIKRIMKIGIVCYPTFGGSGVVATELGKALAKSGHQVHFITYSQPQRLDFFNENLYYHEVNIPTYPLFQYAPYESALSSDMVHVVNSAGLICFMYIMQFLMLHRLIWRSKFSHSKESTFR